MSSFYIILHVFLEFTKSSLHKDHVPNEMEYNVNGDVSFKASFSYLFASSFIKCIGMHSHFLNGCIVYGIEDVRNNDGDK